MATFDQLSDEQRAIVELVLERGRGYGELRGILELADRPSRAGSGPEPRHGAGQHPPEPRPRRSFDPAPGS